VTEQDLPRKLAQRLDEGLDRLPPGVSYRLQAAREAAVERARDRDTPLARSAAGALAAGLARNPARRMLAPLIAVVLALLAMLTWQQAQRPSHNGHDADIDAELLAEELPVTAYLDRGFEVWLYHSTPASERR
jgi:hypothetical protein